MYIEMAKMITSVMYPDWNWNNVVHRFCGISTLTRCHKLSTRHTFLSARHRHHRCRCCCYYKKGFDFVLFIVLCCCYLIDGKLIAADADGNQQSSAQIVENRISDLNSQSAPLLAVTAEEEYEDEELDDYQLLITNKSGKFDLEFILILQKNISDIYRPFHSLPSLHFENFIVQTIKFLEYNEGNVQTSDWRPKRKLKKFLKYFPHWNMS